MIFVLHRAFESLHAMFIRRIIVLAVILGAAEIILLAHPAPAVRTFAALSTARTLAQLSKPRVVLQLKATLSGHTKNIVEIAFSPDGQTVATGSEDGMVRLWNTRTGEELATLPHAGRYEALKIVWSPDGRSIAIDCNPWHGDGETQIWDAHQGKVLALLPTREDHSLIWSPNGQMILTTRLERLGRVWNARTGALLATLEQDPPCPKLSFWKSRSQNNLCSETTVVTGSFVADGRTVITTSWDHAPKVWDAETGKLKTMLGNAGTSARLFRLVAIASPDGRLAVTYDHRGVVLWDSLKGEVKLALDDIGAPLALSPDGKTLLTAQGEPARIYRNEVELRLYDVATGQLRTTFERIPAGVSRDNIYWSPEGRSIVVIGAARTQTRILDTGTGRVTAKLPYVGCIPDTWFGNGGCEPFIFSVDGRVALKEKNPLRLWSTETGELLTTLDAASTPAVFSPTNPHTLVTRGKDKRTALIWEVSWQ